MPKLGCSIRVLAILTIVVLALLVLGFMSGALGASLLGSSPLPSFFTVPRPHPELPAETIFHVSGFPIANTIIAAWITIVVLLAIFFFATRRMRLVPRGIQNLAETILELLLNFVEGVAGKENGRRFFPLVASIFLFVIMNAWLSLLPGFNSFGVKGEEGGIIPILRGANTDINLPLALALMSFVFVEYWGIRSVGFFKYMGKFVAVRQLFKGRILFGIIDLFVGFLETLGEFVRILSFTFRLFGNMTAGEILLLMVMFLVPWVLALPFYGLEMLVGFVQALIFGGLTLVFATTAVTAHGEEHSEESH